MKRKIVGIVILMLVATTVVSATNINVKERDTIRLNSEPYEPGLFEWWNVDQKQTRTDGYGSQQAPPWTNAQSFIPTKNKLTAVSLWFFKYATPPEPVHITVSIRDNLTGPDLATKTIDTSVVIINSTWVLFDFDDISITAGSKYYIVCSGDAGNSNNAYCWFFSGNDTYTRGEAWVKVDGDPWIVIPSGVGDYCFKTYFRKPLDISSTLKTNENNVPSNPQTYNMVGDWVETQKILASDGTAGDTFGNLVAMDGDYAVIGANQDDQNGAGAGSAYVFVRSGDNWTQQAKLLPSDGNASDNFGEPAIYGNTALIGSPMDDDMGVNSGSAYIFVRTGSTWTQQAKLLPLDGEAGDSFGLGLPSIYGDTALIGAPFDDDMGADSGAAYVFIRNGTTWTQQAKIVAPDGQAGDEFGYSVYIDGDTALIGAPLDDDQGTNTGSAYIFTRTEDTWSQQQKITVSDSTLNDIFGQAVALDGNTALIGAPGYGPNATQIGAAYIFTRTDVTWTERAMLTASDAQTNDQFSSWAVALDQNTAIIGAFGDDVVGSNSGSAYVFATTDGIHWTEQQKLVPSDGASGDEFGAIAFDGNSAIITSWHDDDNGANSGSAYAFTKKGLSFSISGGIGVKVDITNEASTDLNDIPWQIHVEGGILGMINKTVSGTVDIPAGDTVTVSTGMLLGFGTISITAKVADEEKTATGTILLFFVLGVKES